MRLGSGEVGPGGKTEDRQFVDKVQGQVCVAAERSNDLLYKVSQEAAVQGKPGFLHVPYES